MAPRLELMSLGKVRSALRNPKSHDMEGIKTSIRRFGFKDFPTINEATLRLVEGHGRLLALKAIKKEGPKPDIDAQWPPENIVEKGRSWYCPVVRGQSWKDDAEAAAYLAAHNQLTMSSGWEDKGLADLFREVANSEHAFEGLGFEQDFVQQLMVTEGGSSLTPPAPPSSTPDEGTLPALPAKPKTKVGDVWMLGDHRIICGDCRDPAVVAKLLEGRQVNVAITSPPYASQRKYDEESGFKPIRPDDYVEWFEAVAQNVKDALADDGSWFLNIKEHCHQGERVLYVKDLTLAHARDWGWRFVDEFCWQRVCLPGRFPHRFKNGWEPVFHYAKQQAIKFRPDNVTHEFDSLDTHVTSDQSRAAGRAWPGTGRSVRGGRRTIRGTRSG